MYGPWVKYVIAKMKHMIIEMNMEIGAEISY